MQLNEDKLKEKGWSQGEIDHAKGIWDKAKNNRSARHLFIEKLTYWILLVLLLGGTLAGAWVSIPFLVLLPDPGAIVAVAIIGLLFGTLTTILVNDLEHLKNTHHVLISILIPLGAVLASIIIYRQLEIITNAAEVSFEHNALLITIVFAIANILPYIILLLRSRKQQ